MSLKDNNNPIVGSRLKGENVRKGLKGVRVARSDKKRI